MPLRKRNQLQAAISKQRKLTKKRLMEISIRVDNYIYNNKSMTVIEAENYVREISTYKLHCNSDIPMLQVIEKLTRLIKMIIEETNKNSTATGKTNDFNVEDKVASSLVSSMNKEKEDNGMSEIDNRNFEIVASKNIIRNNIEGNPIITTKSDDKHEPQNCKIINKEQTCRINKTSTKYPASIGGSDGTAIRSISATEDIANTKNIKLILDELNNNSNTAAKKGNINKMKLNKRQLKTTELKPIRIIKNTQHKSRPPLKLHQTDTDVNKYSGETIQNAYQENHIVDESNAIKELLKINTSSEQTSEKGRRRVQKKSGKKNIASTTKGEKERRRGGRTNTKQKNKQSINAAAMTPPLLFPNDVNSSITANIQTCGSVVNDEKPFNASRAERNEFKNFAINEDSLFLNQTEAPKAAQQVVANDLSWIDGVEYVREVSTVEFGPVLKDFKESFWDNFVLPAGWDDAEFLY